MVEPLARYMAEQQQTNNLRKGQGKMKTLTLSATLVALLITAFAVSAFANGTVMTPPAAAGEGAGPTISPAVPSPPASARTWTQEQLVTMTVAEAWEYSGRDYTVFTAMVRDAADLSMQKRGVTIPDSIEAGSELGRMIRQRAEADPDQLLYVVVDSSIRDYAAAHAQPNPPATTCP